MPRLRSKAGIDRLAFHREHAEHALVHPVEGLVSTEPLECLDPESELSDGERALASEVAGSQAIDLVGVGVLGTVDEAEVLATPALNAGLHEAVAPLGDEIIGLTTMPSPPPAVNCSHHAVPAAVSSASVTSTARRPVR
jgi:hypothetical protein